MAKKQLNVNFNQSLLSTAGNKDLLKEIRVHLTTFEQMINIFNDLTDLTNSITFFILILLHTVSKMGMYGLQYILTYTLLTYFFLFLTYLFL